MKRIDMKKYIAKTFVALATGLLITSACNAEVAVIVHPSNSTASLSVDEVKDIFLGKTKKFSNGSKIIVTDHQSGSVKDEFLDKVIQKNANQFKAYWSRLIFTGKGRAPVNVDDSSVVGKVGSNADYIGYVEPSKVSDAVKVVAVIK
jgi:ABC-type phosphate transport system substrate-binding protein